MLPFAGLFVIVLIIIFIIFAAKKKNKGSDLGETK